MFLKLAYLPSKLRFSANICFIKNIKFPRGNYQPTHHKKINLWNYGIWRHFSNRASLQRVLAKNYFLIVISSRNIKDKSLILPYTNLSNFESVPNWRKRHKFWRVCMGCYQTLIPDISVRNCNSELIFGMRASFRILYKNMTSYPIISHHFRTLLLN